jgi:hypothetical protein
MAPLQPHWVQPSHPDIIDVVIRPEAFTSGAYSLVALPRGALLTPMTAATPTPTKAYSSVQTGPSTHIELNSDIVFCNHSCAPTLEFDMKNMEVRVNRNRDLKVGDELSFFYPSSEWDMAQAFDCKCGAKECKGSISGAGTMKPDQLRGYWLNDHILKLLEEKKKASLVGANGKAHASAVTNAKDDAGKTAQGTFEGSHGRPADDKLDSGYSVDGRVGPSSRALAGECGGGTSHGLSQATGHVNDKSVSAE